MEKLNVIDKFFVMLDGAGSIDSVSQKIASFVFLDAMPDVEVFKHRITNTLEIFPKLRKKIVRQGKQFFWQADSNFSLNNHFHVVINERLSSKADLEALMQEYFNQKLDMASSPWKIILISNTQEGKVNNSAGNTCLAGVVFVFHHVLSDGVGAFEIFNSFTGISKEDSLKLDRQQIPLNLHQHRYFSSAILKSFHNLRSLIYLGFSQFPIIFKSAISGKNSPKREVSFFTLMEDEIRSIKDNLQCSVNHLSLLLVSRTLRNYFLAKKVLPQKVRLIVPINMRTGNLRYSLGNCLSAVCLYLPVNEEFILQQLKIISEKMQRVWRHNLYGGYDLLCSMIFGLPKFLHQPLAELVVGSTNGICTNVPGPRNYQYLAGACVQENYGAAALMARHGIACTFVHYAKKLFMSIETDAAIIQDKAVLVEAFLKARQEISNTTAHF